MSHCLRDTLRGTRKSGTSNKEIHVAKSLLGIQDEQPKKESIGFRILVQFFKLAQAPAKFLRQRTVTKARAERHATRMNILAGLNARLKEVDDRIDTLIHRSVVERINLDHEIEVSTNHKLYLEGEIQRYS